MSAPNKSEAQALWDAGKETGIGTQIARVGFVRTGRPPNYPELIAQQNVDWMNTAMGGSVEPYIPPPPPEVRVHISGRYLTRGGTPWRIQSESAWFLGINASRAQRQAYFADRSARGYNCTIIMALVHPGYYVTQGYVQDPPRIKNDATMGVYQNQHPWTNPADVGDFSKLNDTANGYNPLYWENLDNLIDDAIAENMVIQVAYAYSGYGREAYNSANCQGWWDQIAGAGPKFANNTQQACFDYGAWLATRWESRSWAILWMADGDATPVTAEARARYKKMRDGIRSVLPYATILTETDGNLVVESGSQPVGTSTPSDYTPYDDDLSVETFYGYDNALSGYFSSSPHRAYGQTRTPVHPRPAWVTEPWYAYDLFTANTRTARAGTWTSVLGGGTAGDSSSQYPLWTGPHPTDSWTWESQFNRSYVRSRQYLFDLMASFEWWKLVPRTVDSGTGWALTGPEIIASGAGTGLTRIVGATTDDGKVGVIYAPANGTTNAVSFGVNLSLMSGVAGGSVRARWLDPVTGVYTTIGTFSNTLTNQNFTSPAGGRLDDESEASNDWVLVLD